MIHLKRIRNGLGMAMICVAILSAIVGLEFAARWAWGFRGVQMTAIAIAAICVCYLLGLFWEKA